MESSSYGVNWARGCVMREGSVGLWRVAWRAGNGQLIVDDAFMAEKNSENVRLYCPVANNQCDLNSFPSALSVEIEIIAVKDDGKSF